jgi:putative nucleotidyltransferase with HDIG domain
MNAIGTLDIIKSIRDLPSLPTAVMDLLHSFDQSDVGLSDVADKVAQDQALAAKTLRLANSSFYGLSRKVTTIQQAIAILGFDNVRTLITAASITEIMPTSKDIKFDFKLFWRHSIGTALCAKYLARPMNFNQNYAFICGLLHDIGRLVLVTKFTPQYEEVMECRARLDCHIVEAERTILGVDHTLVGRLLAEAWKFPTSMHKAIANHHAPEIAEAGDIPGVVHIADAIMHALDLAGQDDDLVPPICDKTWRALSARGITLEKIYLDVGKDFDAACQALGA